MLMLMLILMQYATDAYSQINFHSDDNLIGQRRHFFLDATLSVFRFRKHVCRFSTLAQKPDRLVCDSTHANLWWRCDPSSLLGRVGFLSLAASMRAVEPGSKRVWCTVHRSAHQSGTPATIEGFGRLRV